MSEATEPVTLILCGGGCTCHCPDGPCEHKWDGPEVEWDNVISVTCSKCGTPAITHDLRTGP